jgi:hypothetical protein
VDGLPSTLLTFITEGVSDCAGLVLGAGVGVRWGKGPVHSIPCFQGFQGEIIRCQLCSGRPADWAISYVADKLNRRESEIWRSVTNGGVE